MIRFALAPVCLFQAVLLLVLWTPSCSLPLTKKAEEGPVTKLPPPGRDEPYMVLGKTYFPLKSSEGFSEMGIASWYGEDFHGNRSSSGETYNMYAMTAAHKLLPFNTMVLVRNQTNGKEVTVRINDRGPFVPGRTIDLSYRAAREIGLIPGGTAKVLVKALGIEKKVVSDGEVKVTYEPQPDYGVGNFTVQVGSFASKENAERLAETLKPSHAEVHITEYERGDQTLFQVRVSKSDTLEKARKKVSELREDGYADSFVVAE